MNFKRTRKPVADLCEISNRKELPVIAIDKDKDAHLVVGLKWIGRTCYIESQPKSKWLPMLLVRAIHVRKIETKD